MIQYVYFPHPYSYHPRDQRRCCNALEGSESWKIMWVPLMLFCFDQDHFSVILVFSRPDQTEHGLVILSADWQSFLLCLLEQSWWIILENASATYNSTSYDPWWSSKKAVFGVVTCHFAIGCVHCFQFSYTTFTHGGFWRLPSRFFGENVISSDFLTIYTASRWHRHWQQIPCKKMLSGLKCNVGADY